MITPPHNETHWQAIQGFILPLQAQNAIYTGKYIGGKLSRRVTAFAACCNNTQASHTSRLQATQAANIVNQGYCIGGKASGLYGAYLSFMADEVLNGYFKRSFKTFITDDTFITYWTDDTDDTKITNNTSFTFFAVIGIWDLHRNLGFTSEIIGIWES